MKTKKIKRSSESAALNSAPKRQRFRLRVVQRRVVRFSILICVVFASFACTPRSFEKANVAAPPPNESNQTDFERDLETMKTAGFEFIFVFRRKDGGAFDGEDRKFLRSNSPAETNRFVLTDDGRAFIAGSKYLFPPTNLDALRTRFSVEDYSLPKEAK